MEKNFTEGKQPSLKEVKQSFDHKPFIGDKDATSFAIAVDAKGKLGWDSNEIDGDHVIEILSESLRILTNLRGLWWVLVKGL